MPARSQVFSAHSICYYNNLRYAESFRCSEDGAVRLVDGPNAYEGRLEICAQGEWGTVCNDGNMNHNGFDINAARIVCRQLGIEEGGKLNFVIAF